MASKKQADPHQVEGWQQYAIDAMTNMTVNFHVDTGPRVYVLKVGDDYLRIPTGGGRALMVRSHRLATRVDSRLWAMTLAGILAAKDVKVVRLTTKAEREARAEAQRPATTCATWRRTGEAAGPPTGEAAAPPPTGAAAAAPPARPR